MREENSPIFLIRQREEYSYHGYLIKENIKNSYIFLRRRQFDYAYYLYSTIRHNDYIDYEPQKKVRIKEIIFPKEGDDLYSLYIKTFINEDIYKHCKKEVIVDEKLPSKIWMDIKTLITHNITPSSNTVLLKEMMETIYIFRGDLALILLDYFIEKLNSIDLRVLIDLPKTPIEEDIKLVLLRLDYPFYLNETMKAEDIETCPKISFLHPNYDKIVYELYEKFNI